MITSDAVLLMDKLRTVPPLADLAEEHLRWLIGHGEEIWFEEDETVVAEGSPADSMVMLLEGEMEARSGDRPLYLIGAGSIAGKLPHSRMTAYPRTVRAVRRLHVLRIFEKDFVEMLDVIPGLEGKLIQIMADRIREFTAAEVQQSKLAALGKLSAGLAHELNNPAAAAARAAGQLRENLRCIRELDHAFAMADLTQDQRTAIVDAETLAIANAEKCGPLDTLTRSDREEALGDQLSKMGVEVAWDLAPELVDAGFTAESLSDFSKQSGVFFKEALAHMALLIAMDRLAEEVQESMARISSLVKSIKEYSYMDNAGEREVDLHKDLENTLRVLSAKITRSGVTIERQYDSGLPLVCGNGGQLNQVWTNLIDNAVDAMAGLTSGEKILRITTSRKLDRAVVEVLDTGPGVPPNIQQRIFEPFFTTKPQGQGTGLGLDVVQKVISQHQGDIRLESKPGRTCFQVFLPIEGRRGSPAS